MKVRAKSLTQFGATLEVGFLLCGLFYSNLPGLPTIAADLLTILVVIILVLARLLIFAIVPCFFWTALGVLLVLSFLQEKSVDQQ